MKRLTIVLLCVALAFSLVACGGDKEPATNPGTSEQESTTTTASTESAEPTDSTTEADTTASSDATGTTGKTEASKTESTAATAPTTKKPTSASNTTQVANNEINWEDTFGADTTVASGSNGSTETTTTVTTTTTTTAATTTTTVPPTKVEEVLLPAVGTDVDVVKQKGRIRISDIKLEKSVLTITIKNESKNWINQETDWVQFACYDKDGKELKGEGELFGRIYLGCLECGDSITETINLPVGTAKVEITNCEIVYWTPWK